MRLFTLPLLALSLSTTLALQGQSSKLFDKSYPVNGRPTLQVEVDDTSIRTESCGGCRDIRIHVDMRDADLSDFRLQESQSGSLVRFSLKRREHFGFHIGLRRSPEMKIEVPTQSDLALRSGDGALQLTGVQGNVELHTGDGSITAANTSGPLRLSTGDGAITLRQVEGALTATTGDGSIQGEGRFTQLDARTGDGSVHVAALEGSPLTGGAHITTGDGSVELRLPRSVHADLQLRAGDGSVSCDLPLQQQSNSSDRHSLRGSLNGGGAVLHISTGDGSVSVRPL